MNLVFSENTGEYLNKKSVKSIDAFKFRKDRKYSKNKIEENLINNEKIKNG